MDKIKKILLSTSSPAAIAVTWQMLPFDPVIQEIIWWIKDVILFNEKHLKSASSTLSQALLNVPPSS